MICVDVGKPCNRLVFHTYQFESIKKRETASFVIQSPAKVAVSAVVQQFGSNKLTTDL